ncbi:MAG TPA: hypothetical protein VFW50_43690 [Streptosporangiaceae bacterium]|nr:hypothetical protein [Streptosporangiaceae bacterium]
MASTGKQLICPLCEKVMASAAWRFFTGLRITALDGSQLTPVSNDLLLRSTETRLAEASAENQPQARRRRACVLSHGGDRIYDIRCPDGHDTLRPAPEISQAMRRTSGAWVTLA